jgi:hypothetical protein
MEVPATGMGPPGPDPAAGSSPISRPSNSPPSGRAGSPSAGDSAATLLAGLSQSDRSRLVEILESTPPRGGAALGERLALDALEAASSRSPERALDLVRQLAKLDPDRAAALRSAPELESMRPGVEQLLGQLTATARLHAEGRLAEATQKLENFTGREIAVTEVRPEVLLSVAGALFDAGGMTNYARSAAISELLIDQCRWAPADVPAPVALRAANRREPVSRRLLLIWLACGLTGAIMCWWVRDEWLPTVCAAWGAGLAVLIIRSAWRR